MDETKHVSAEEFVRVWQKAETLEDVVRELGMKKPSLRMRAENYRKKGVKLKELKSEARTGRARIDVEALNKIIRVVDKEKR